MGRARNEGRGPDAADGVHWLARLTFDDVPPSLNVWSRKHWSVRRALVEKWKLMARAKRHTPTAGPVVVRVTYHSPRPMDPDNGAKLVMDAIKGVLIDDDNAATVTELRLRSRKGPRCTVVDVGRASEL